MKNGRNQTDVLSIERTLGLKSERGVSRQGNKESPPIEAILKGIKMIMVAYVNQDLTIIRDSDALKAEATALFDKHAPAIWPGPDEPRPHWIEEPSETRLKERFIQLVIEKSCNYHENQLQKHRRHTAKALQTQLNAENDEDSRGEDNDHDPSGSEPPTQPASKIDEFQSQFAAYTQPVPDEDLKPHGLPSTEGVYPRSGRKRQRTATNGEEGSASKRTRSESETGSSTPEESLVVRLNVGEQALGKLAAPGKVNSAYSFQPVNGPPTAREASEPPRVHGFNPVNATPAQTAPSASAPPPSMPPASVASPSARAMPVNRPQPPTSPPSTQRSPVPPPNAPHLHTQRPPPTLTGFAGPSEPPAEGQRPDQRREDPSDPRNYESPYQHHLQAQKVEQFRPGFHAVNAPAPPNARPPVMPIPSHAMQNPFRTFPPAGAPSGPPLGPPNTAFGGPPPLPGQHPPGQHLPPSHQQGPPPPGHANALRPSHVPLPEPVLSALGLHGPRPQSRSKQPHRRPSSSTQSQRRPSATPTLPPIDLPQDRKAPQMQHPVATPDPLDQDICFFEDVLGELAFCPVIMKLKEELGSKMPRHRLEKLKKLLVDFPDARYELEALERRARMPAEQYEAERLPPPGWVPNPVGVWVPGPNAQQQQPQPYPSPHAFGRDAALTPRPTPGPPGHAHKNEPLTPQVKDEPSDAQPSRTLDNISVEINWNRNLDYSDFIEMQEFDTVQKLFDMVEEQRPEELLQGGDVIKEIRIKSKTELQGPGGQVLPRIVHDEMRGRAGVKQLIRRLRSQPPGMEIELLFEVMWKPAETATPA
ncbi:hypothetical protein Slin15195_G086290 [Septoria linicola]|uniref:Uncharacterized protein n=1 Tax=Septoria linicola TaxID=215465 RepID=A0A9Q9AUD4_9PEZI|nr:hypothetical protein Slin14017_G088880 [Septoria linicola]USW55310.1 hypothetical protein Slin15195_G086290 [Septoria linicola]